jgi:hypothetical protein
MTTIQCFWHGTPISLLEKLTLKSFAAKGYKVNLWVYEETNISIDGVEVCDANKIIPFKNIFVYSGNGDCRRGSIGGFSDLFRYMLIYKEGGTYVDMDSVCLSYFEFNDYEYVIKPHKGCGAVANVLKAPASSLFLKACIEKTQKLIDSDNSNWVLPVDIFFETVKEFNLKEKIMPISYFGQDCVEDLRVLKSTTYIQAKSSLPQYILHWCREASYGNWCYREYYNWNKPKPLSLYYFLLMENGLI